MENGPKGGVGVGGRKEERNERKKERKKASKLIV